MAEGRGSSSSRGGRYNKLHCPYHPKSKLIEDHSAGDIDMICPECGLVISDLQADISCFAVGLMSGTSMDGIDACVVEIMESKQAGKALKLKMVGFVSHPYTVSLQNDLIHLSTSGTVSEVCRFNTLLGKMFADAVSKVVTECGMEMKQISIIGSHGQTIHHLPDPHYLHGYQISSTLQIGDPSIIAIECGVPTVGDFRVSDMAVGGQGAPLVPYLDEIILKRHFEETGRVGMLLNIGGISNISALVPCPNSADVDHSDFKFVGFDCGPGNILINMLMKKWYNKEFDKGGQIALSGNVSKDLLNQMLKDDYIYKTPPKSTGREHFGETYLDAAISKMEDLHLSREDFVATITEFTAAAVWSSYKLFIAPMMTDHLQKIAMTIGDEQPRECDLFVSGGGAKNNAIMRGLANNFQGCHVTTTKAIGIDPDAKEAICFALLGYQTWKGRPTNIPNVTGAKERVILGKVCPVLKTTEYSHERWLYCN